MPALPRVMCPICQKLVPVRVNGDLREHRDMKDATKNCPGSGKPAV